jgi:hypothetical protein
MAKKQDGIDLEAVRRLVDAAYELIAKQAATLEELRKILGGGVALGEQMKDAHAAFAAAHATRYPGQYVWIYKKDSPQMKRLLLALGLEELRDRFGRYIQNSDPFFMRARHSFGAFVSTVNQHAAPAAAAPDLELEDGERPAGCKHIRPVGTTSSTRNAR